MANLVRTQVLFSVPMLEDLRLLAAEKGWSVSEAVRSLVGDRVGRLRKRKRTAMGAMTLMVKGAYQGKVPADLSTNDDYLYGYGGKA